MVNGHGSGFPPRGKREVAGLAGLFLKWENNLMKRRLDSLAVGSSLSSCYERLDQTDSNALKDQMLRVNAWIAGIGVPLSQRLPRSRSEALNEPGSDITV